MKIDYVRRTIERKLAAATGLPVRIDEFAFSPITGSIEARGLVVGDPDDPILSVRKVRAAVAVGRAIRGEILVESVAIEAPVLRLTRRADGTWNLPARPQMELANGDDDEGDDAKWSFDCRTGLLVDGEAHMRIERADRPAVTIVAGGGLAKLAHTAEGLKVTLIVESLGPDGANLGELTGHAMFDRVADFNGLRTAAVSGELSHELGVRVRFESPGRHRREASAVLEGSVQLSTLATLASILPANVARILIASSSEEGGRVEFSVRAEFSGGRLTVREAIVRALDVAL